MRWSLLQIEVKAARDVIKKYEGLAVQMIIDELQSGGTSPSQSAVLDGQSFKGLWQVARTAKDSSRPFAERRVNYTLYLYFYNV